MAFRFHALVATVALVAGSWAAEGKRESIPIGGEWNLSAKQLERTRLGEDGKKVDLMTAKGEAKLKRGRNALLGPWILEASAETIEADFTMKRFLVRGPFTITRETGEGGQIEVTGTGDNSSAELSFHDGAVKVSGPNRTRLVDAEEKKPKKPAPKSNEPAAKRSEPAPAQK